MSQSKLCKYAQQIEDDCQEMEKNIENHSAIKTLLYQMPYVKKQESEKALKEIHQFSKLFMINPKQSPEIPQEIECLKLYLIEEKFKKQNNIHRMKMIYSADNQKILKLKLQCQLINKQKYESQFQQNNEIRKYSSQFANQKYILHQTKINKSSLCLKRSKSEGFWKKDKQVHFIFVNDESFQNNLFSLWLFKKKKNNQNNNNSAIFGINQNRKESKKYLLERIHQKYDQKSQL